MNDQLTIREAAAVLGCPRKMVFSLLLHKRLSYALDPGSERFLLDAGEVERVQSAGLAWARAWRDLHPDDERIDRLFDWAE